MIEGDVRFGWKPDIGLMPPNVERGVSQFLIDGALGGGSGHFLIMAPFFRVETQYFVDVYDLIAVR